LSSSVAPILWINADIYLPRFLPGHWLGVSRICAAWVRVKSDLVQIIKLKCYY
jgi:hypothetical protein